VQGLILIDKPEGITSFGVVAKLKWLCQTKRVGHTGTLDPMATGVLPVFVGRPTVLSNYLLEADKEYVASVQLGIKTDTLDITGNILEKKPVNIKLEELLAVKDKFSGVISQVPPMYSAIKKDGVPLYKMAREGKEIERSSRQVEIKKLDIFDFDGTNFKMRVLCSKGTYIRSLAEDIGHALGTGAALTSLRRTKTGGFDIEQTVSFNDLTRENVENHLINEECAVLGFPKIQISEKQAFRFSNGGELDLNRLHLAENMQDGQIFRVAFKEKFIGLGKISFEKNALTVEALINFMNT
jgi:tRNA pseudouridine55 synthase